MKHQERIVVCQMECVMSLLITWAGQPAHVIKIWSHHLINFINLISAILSFWSLLPQITMCHQWWHIRINLIPQWHNSGVIFYKLLWNDVIQDTSLLPTRKNSVKCIFLFQFWVYLDELGVHFDWFWEENKLPTFIPLYHV